MCRSQCKRIQAGKEPPEPHHRRWQGHTDSSEESSTVATENWIQKKWIIPLRFTSVCCARAPRSARDELLASYQRQQTGFVHLPGLHGPGFCLCHTPGHLQPIKSRSPFTWTDWVLSQTDRDVFEVWLSTETLLGDKRAYFVNEQTNKSHRAETGLYSLQETKAHLELTALNYIKNHSENAVLLQKLVRDADCVFSALCDTSVRGQVTSVSSTPSFPSASWNCSFGSRPPPLHVLARLAKFWGSPRLTLPFKASTKYSSTEILSKLFFMDWLTHLGKLYSEFRPDKRCSLSW